jgi:cytochrome c biogenesis factor
LLTIMPMPPIDPVRVGEHVHGHLGWLAAIALLHPAVILRRRTRRAHLSVALSVATATLAGTIGAALYPAYRERLRQPIFATAPTLGYLFERKEHLAFGAIVLAWTGAVTYVGALASGIDDTTRDALRKASHWAFIASAVASLAAAVFGTIVASYRSL